MQNLGSIKRLSSLHNWQTISPPSLTNRNFNSAPKSSAKMGINSNRVENFSDPEAPPPPPPTNAMQVMEVHRVCVPPLRSTAQKLRHRLSEIFFPDDPLHKFKDQTWLRRLLLALQFLFPIFHWAPNYTFQLLKSDLVSGITIASLAIPQVPELDRLWASMSQEISCKIIVSCFIRHQMSRADNSILSLLYNQESLKSEFSWF